ncbi:hypothetical protein DBV15_03618 [Temnothorax longispinosus]|uniref:Uncharacterized protein n=1 Tax=Temnothorax longispinosus TaxID=300112 RepID=A0A4S2KQ16_9HYME|nr:hypothetical protein DBV15_03618 [Temnothorax longispinosus]
MSDFEGASAIRIGGDSQYPARRPFNAEFIDTIDARERAINESGWPARETRGCAPRYNTLRGRDTMATRERGGGKRGEKKKNAKRAAEFRAAASSSVTVAARILLDIPRVVRMRSSECRARKPRRMAPRVWVVRKGQGLRRGRGRSGGRTRTTSTGRLGAGYRGTNGKRETEREREDEGQRDGRSYRGKSTHRCRSYAAKSHLGCAITILGSAALPSYNPGVIPQRRHAVYTDIAEAHGTQRNETRPTFNGSKISPSNASIRVRRWRRRGESGPWALYVIQPSIHRRVPVPAAAGRFNQTQAQPVQGGRVRLVSRGALLKRVPVAVPPPSSLSGVFR